MCNENNFEDEFNNELFPTVASNNEAVSPVRPHNSTGLTINQVVEEGMQQIRALREQNITSADFDNGQKFQYSHEGNISTISNQNMALSVGEHGVNIFLPNPNSSPKDILRDFDNMSKETQRMRGAVVGRSQSWVSNQDSDN